MAQALKRTAVLVIRVWFEEGLEEAPMRARITGTPDVSVPGASDTRGAASEQEVVTAVRTWLRQVMAER